MKRGRHAGVRRRIVVAPEKRLGLIADADARKRRIEERHAMKVRKKAFDSAWDDDGSG